MSHHGGRGVPAVQHVDVETVQEQDNAELLSAEKY